MIGALLKIVPDVLDKVIPDPVARDKAKAELLKQEQAGQFKELETRTNIIVAEAQSDNFFTSAARPMFLWVMYLLIIGGAFIMGPLFAFYPEAAKNVVLGMKNWLEAIPTEMWVMFTTGYLGYTTNRSGDKARKMGAEPAKGVLSKLFG